MFTMHSKGGGVKLKCSANVKEACKLYNLQPGCHYSASPKFTHVYVISSGTRPVSNATVMRFKLSSRLFYKFISPEYQLQSHLPGGLIYNVDYIKSAYTRVPLHPSLSELQHLTTINRIIYMYVTQLSVKYIFAGR